MTRIELLIGLSVVLIAAVAILLLSSRKIRTRFPVAFRRIPAIHNLRRAIGQSVEGGSRLHVSLGTANLNDPSNTSSMAGLSTLHRLGQLGSTSDQPPVSTCGDGGFSILSRDVLHAVSIETNTRELYDPDHGQLTGITPFSYVVGSLNVMNDPEVKSNILIGNFGPEAGFLSTWSEEHSSFTMAASDSIIGQSVFLATTRNVLIGEELFSIPAYLALSPVHIASLRVQDIARSLLGTVLIAGGILRLAGLL